MTTMIESSDDLRAIGNEHSEGFEPLARAAGVDIVEVREWAEYEVRFLLDAMIESLEAEAKPGKAVDIAAYLRAVAAISLCTGFINGVYYERRDDGDE